MKFSPAAKIYTLDIDGKPTVSFEAVNPREGTELLKEGWFLDDLSKLTTNGRPLWDGASTLRVRPASEGEADRYQSFAEEAEDTNGDILLAFLVTLDGKL